MEDPRECVCGGLTFRLLNGCGNECRTLINTSDGVYQYYDVIRVLLWYFFIIKVNWFRGYRGSEYRNLLHNIQNWACLWLSCLRKSTFFASPASHTVVNIDKKTHNVTTLGWNSQMRINKCMGLPKIGHPKMKILSLFIYPCHFKPVLPVFLCRTKRIF